VDIPILPIGIVLHHCNVSLGASLLMVVTGYELSKRLSSGKKCFQSERMVSKEMREMFSKEKCFQ
jgi:hypothetical protein